MKRVTTSYHKVPKMTPIKQLAWGLFWGTCIGSAWFVADMLRPIIYGGL